MVKRFLGLVVALLLMNLGTLQTTNAKTQDDNDARKIEKLKVDIRKLGVGKETRVEIRLRDGNKLKGHIREVHDSDFVVVEDKTGTDVTVEYSNVAQPKVVIS